MAQALRNQSTFALTIPTIQDMERVFLAPDRDALEIDPEWDEDGGLTNIKYYSPTSD